MTPAQDEARSAALRARLGRARGLGDGPSRMQPMACPPGQAGGILVDADGSEHEGCVITDEGKLQGRQKRGAAIGLLAGGAIVGVGMAGALFGELESAGLHRRANLAGAAAIGAGIAAGFTLLVGGVLWASLPPKEPTT